MVAAAVAETVIVDYSFDHQEESGYVSEWEAFGLRSCLAAGRL